MSIHNPILLVDDDPMLTRMVEPWLTAAGYRVEVRDNATAAIEAFERVVPCLVLLDIHMEGISGMQALSLVKQTHPDVPVVMLTAEGSVHTVVAAMQAGAYDYLRKPVQRERLLVTVRNAIAMAEQAARQRRDERGRRFGDLIGRAPAMLAMYEQLDRVSSSDVTVLVQGESGTGKELVASAIHTHSRRAHGPFVAINCAAVPEALQESELFGHEKGAFTGADSAHPGRFEQAHGGTLFLDEVGELAPALQAKLLRVLQERRFYRVGGTTERTVDVRIVAATHRNLPQAVADGRFREDLFYRLAVFELLVPPLRERAEDVPLLSGHFLKQLCAQHGGRELQIAESTAAVLRAHHWPGNVRELRNAMERAVVVASNQLIRPQDLPPRIWMNEPAPSRPGPSSAEVEASGSTLAPAPPVVPEVVLEGLTAMERLERKAIVECLAANRGNVSEVIRALGIPRTSMYRKIRRYRIET